MEHKVHIWHDPYVSKKKVKDIEYIINSNGCHICISHNSIGRGTVSYPTVYRYGKTWSVHRYVCETEKGPVPKGMDVLHSCDNRKCINIEHLSMGTRKENMADMFAKNRAPTRKGKRDKLTKTDVLVIYADPRACWEIANDYGVSVGTISYVKSGYTRNKVWREYHGQETEAPVQLHQGEQGTGSYG